MGRAGRRSGGRPVVSQAYLEDSGGLSEQGPKHDVSRAVAVVPITTVPGRGKSPGIGDSSPLKRGRPGHEHVDASASSPPSDRSGTDKARPGSGDRRNRQRKEGLRPHVPVVSSSPGAAVGSKGDTHEADYPVKSTLVRVRRNTPSGHPGRSSGGSDDADWKQFQHELDGDTAGASGGVIGTSHWPHSSWQPSDSSTSGNEDDGAHLSEVDTSARDSELLPDVGGHAVGHAGTGSEVHEYSSIAEVVSLTKMIAPGTRSLSGQLREDGLGRSRSRGRAGKR